MSVYFEVLEDTLRRAGAAMGAAEVHGALCGYLCVDEIAGEARWVSDILAGIDSEAVQTCQADLDELYRDTRNELHDENLGFQLLLPTDENALGMRVDALGQWCYGFSSGLVLAGLTPERLSHLSEQTREFVDDIGQIAQISPEMVAYDESEADYAELIEYVRIGVLSLFDELQPIAPQPGSLH